VLTVLYIVRCLSDNRTWQEIGAWFHLTVGLVACPREIRHRFKRWISAVPNLTFIIIIFAWAWVRERSADHSRHFFLTAQCNKAGKCSGSIITLLCAYSRNWKLQHVLPSPSSFTGGQFFAKFKSLSHDVRTRSNDATIPCASQSRAITLARFFLPKPTLPLHKHTHNHIGIINIIM